VVILGGLTSVPGAIIGGLIIGVGEALRGLPRPLVGGGIEIWFAYVLALVFLLFRPQGCSAKRSSTASEQEQQERTMFYRENGQFKTSYRADQQIFPIAQDRWPSCCCWRWPSWWFPAGQRLLFRAILIPWSSCRWPRWA
jgi:hypothetical protein